MNISTRDIITICGYITSGAALISGQVLTTLGLSQVTASKVTTIIGIIVGVATLIQNRLLNPSPPPGTVSAVIPLRSVPVVAAAPGTGTPSVAVADPNIVLGVTSATVAPPKQVTQ